MASASPAASALPGLFEPHRVAEDPENPRILLTPHRDYTVPVHITFRDDIMYRAFRRSKDCRFEIRRDPGYHETLSFHLSENKDLLLDPRKLHQVKSYYGQTYDAIGCQTLYANPGPRLLERVPQLTVVCNNKDHKHKVTHVVHRSTGYSAEYRLEIVAQYNPPHDPPPKEESPRKVYVVPSWSEVRSKEDPASTTVPLKVIHNIQSITEGYFVTWS